MFYYTSTSCQSAKCVVQVPASIPHHVQVLCLLCRSLAGIHVIFSQVISLQNVVSAVQAALSVVQVLAGIHIMFSRVIPLQDGHPELHPMWRKAVKFGATCTTQPSDAVTHVAAYVNGTEKVSKSQGFVTS